MNRTDSLDNKAVLVTGSIGGIGRGIAEELAARGAILFLARRPGSPSAATIRRGPPSRHVELDVRSPDDWRRAIERIVDDCGALHGLVNNAAVLEPSVDFTDLTLDRWRRHFAVNLDGAFLGCRTALPAMAATGGGCIVNIASAAAQIAVPQAAPYCVSKAALLALTRLAAQAGGPKQVRVNAVLPGAIDTPMLRRNVREEAALPDFIAALTRLHPIGRIGDPVDVARTVAFLLDPANSLITGALLAVDGGQLVA
jgi:NAD(P)-dependent dehydrogenase (short-subunit alcohol dehydrogenase family)